VAIAWGVEALDLAAYLDRVGAPEQRPDQGYLDRLHEAHIRAFPFETVDALLGRAPALDLPGIQEKSLGGRGGYCF
jgi:N-hydroxyarylamine O-acetyltransferase